MTFPKFPWFRKRGPAVEVKLRPTRPLTTQHEQDDLAELLWRARVQQNIERRRALKLIGERQW